MEFEAISNGKTVRASYQDLAKAAANDGERMLGMGSTPYEVIYQDDERRVRRTVDLREVASASGLDKVDFKFDRDKAIELGLMSKDAKVDQGDVYNLERIKTEEGRMKYLTDKGYAGIIKNGDAYYGTKDGSIVPINYTTGLGVDDVTRIGASAGQMVGSGLAVTAAGGASIVTGGAALAGVVGAGVGGGVAGEAAQRGFDKLVGADAAKYNAELSASEEAVAFGKAGAMGALDAATGQVAGRALAAGKQGVAAGLEAAAGKMGAANPLKQWSEGTAVKMQMSALEQRLPSGVFGGAQSEEVAAAQSLLQAGQKKGVSTGTRQESLETAKGLVDGSLRRGAVASEEEMAQQAILRQQAEALSQKAAKEQGESFASELAKKTGRTQDQILVEEKFKDTSRELFGSKYAKELDEIFAEGGSKEAADAARSKLEAEVVDRFAKQSGIKVARDPVSGFVTGVDQDSMRSFLSKTVDTTFTDASEFIKASKTKINPGDIIPPSAVKQETITALNGVAGALKDKALGELKTDVSKVVAAVKGHTEDAASQARLRDAIGALEDRVRTQYGSSGVNEQTAMALRRIEEATSRYQINATSNVEGLQQVLNIQGEYMTMRKMAADGVLDSGGGTAKFMEGMQTLERLTGDSRATNIREAVAALDLEATLRGVKSEVRSLMEPGERAYADAFQFIRHNTIQKATGAKAKEGILGKVAGNPMAEEVMELVAGLVPGGRAALAATRLAGASGVALSGAAAKARAVVESAKAGAKAAASGAAAMASKPAVQAPIVRQATGAEEALNYSPRKKEEEPRGRLVSR